MRLCPSLISFGTADWLLSIAAAPPMDKPPYRLLPEFPFWRLTNQFECGIVFITSKIAKKDIR